MSENRAPHQASGQTELEEAFERWWEESGLAMTQVKDYARAAFEAGVAMGRGACQ